MKRLALTGLVVVVVAGAATAQIFTTGDAPVAIPDNSGGTITACQTINVPGSITITSVEAEVAASHTWIGDLTVQLTSPAATTVTLLNRPGRIGTGAGNSDDIQIATPIMYQDAAASAVLAEDMGNGCVGIIGVTAGCPDNYIPSPDTADTPIAGLGTNLADFVGEDAQGTWTLCMADSASGDTGDLSSWTLAVNTTVPVELQHFNVE